MRSQRQGSISRNGYYQPGRQDNQGMMAGLGPNFVGGPSAQAPQAEVGEGHSFPIRKHIHFADADNGTENTYVDPDELEHEIPEVEIKKNERAVDAAEKARQEITEEALAAFGIVLDRAALDMSMDDQQLQSQEQVHLTKRKFKRVKVRKNFFSDLANYPELFMELAKHLKIKDLISLYAISKDFHQAVDGSITHCMKGCAEHNASESAKTFMFTYYDPLCVDDPTGQPHPNKPNAVRRVPSLRWLQMVYHREKAIRDILACMAREGHRMPKGMRLSLKKMWVLMDIATTARRTQFLHSKFFTDWDMYHMQMFMIKLDMRFNDPIDGPGDDTLRQLFLGQRGLTPLCKLLKRTAYTDPVDVIKMGIRYRYPVRRAHRGMPMWDIPPIEIGIGHLEGWGAGRIHLRRPDELVIMESVSRNLDLKNHIMEMMLWGYVDPVTGQDIPMTEEEKYMSDDEDGPREPNWNDYNEPEEEVEMEVD